MSEKKLNLLIAIRLQTLLLQPSYRRVGLLSVIWRPMA